MASVIIFICYECYIYLFHSFVAVLISTVVIVFMLPSDWFYSAVIRKQINITKITSWFCFGNRP